MYVFHNHYALKAKKINLLKLIKIYDQLVKTGCYKKLTYFTQFCYVISFIINALQLIVSQS